MHETRKNVTVVIYLRVVVLFMVLLFVSVLALIERSERTAIEETSTNLPIAIGVIKAN